MDIPQPKRLPLSSKGDLVVWGVIVGMAVLAYVLYVVWQKKGKAIWNKLTGSTEDEIALYNIDHTTNDGKEYRLAVVIKDDFFDFELDPPVIDDFEERYLAAEEAGHLDDDRDEKDEEGAKVREELWTMLKNRTAVTFELAQVLDEDRPQIETAFKANCITDAKYRSFKATHEFMQSQFKEIPDIADVIKPGSHDDFLRSVVREVQHRNQFAARRAQLAKLHEVKLSPNDSGIVAPPGGLAPNTPMALYNFTIPEGKDEGDAVSYTHLTLPTIYSV